MHRFGIWRRNPRRLSSPPPRGGVARRARRRRAQTPPKSPPPCGEGYGVGVTPLHRHSEAKAPAEAPPTSPSRAGQQQSSQRPRASRRPPPRTPPHNGGDSRALMLAPAERLPTPSRPKGRATSCEQLGERKGAFSATWPPFQHRFACLGVDRGQGGSPEGRDGVGIDSAYESNSATRHLRRRENTAAAQGKRA
jgi:hypothetical protein